MVKRQLVNQSKWIVLALLISFVLVRFFENAVLKCSIEVKTQHTFLGLNLFLEILIFFVFSTFVVFGIKGYFEMYSQRFSNIIIAISGLLLVFVIFILCYQILFLE
jgi:hypothetical protein